jgi:hypothetical protein
MKDRTAPVYSPSEVDLLTLSDRVKVTLFRCPQCQKLYLTPGRAVYCSAACRQRAYRARASARL